MAASMELTTRCETHAIFNGIMKWAVLMEAMMVTMLTLNTLTVMEVLIFREKTTVKALKGTHRPKTHKNVIGRMIDNPFWKVFFKKQKSGYHIFTEKYAKTIKRSKVTYTHFQ